MVSPVAKRSAAAISLTTCLALTACGGGGKSDGSGGGGGTKLTASTPLDLTRETASPKGMTAATVPGPLGSTLQLYSSKPTTGTADVSTMDTKKYSAPDGKELIAVGWKIKSEDRNQALSDKYSKPMTLNVLDGDKKVASQTVTSEDIKDGGGGSLLPIPKTSGKVTVQLATDGGQQNVEAGTATRNTATSNGLDPATKVNVPVAAQKKCDQPKPVKADTATCTTVNWTLTDHDPTYGWAPPNHAWVVADFGGDPNVQAPHGSFSGGQELAPVADTSFPTGRLGSIANFSKPGLSATDRLIFPVTTQSNPNKLTANLTWSSDEGAPGKGTLTVTGNAPYEMTYGQPGS